MMNASRSDKSRDGYPKQKKGKRGKRNKKKGMAGRIPKKGGQGQSDALAFANVTAFRGVSTSFVGLIEFVKLNLIFPPRLDFWRPCTHAGSRRGETELEWNSTRIEWKRPTNRLESASITASRRDAGPGGRL